MSPQTKEQDANAKCECEQKQQHNSRPCIGKYVRFPYFFLISLSFFWSSWYGDNMAMRVDSRSVFDFAADLTCNIFCVWYSDTVGNGSEEAAMDGRRSLDRQTDTSYVN